jgi:Cu-Zn family superoxide dismutase
MVRRRIYTIADLDVNSSFIFAPDAFLALDYAGAPTLFQLEREIENNLHTNQDLKVGCPVCGNVDLFTREINTKGRRFRCGYCFYNSESEFETVKSQKDITLAKFGLLYECQICGEAIDSYNRGTVLRHIKKHQDENKVLESEGSAEELISISEIKSLLRELKDNDYDWQDVVDWETDKPTPADNWDIEWEAEENIVYAVAVLQPENSKVSGVVHFADAGSGVAINYQIKGLTDGKHGFHIHEYGDLTDGCTSACAHFNPDNEVHGGLETPVRHFGDLGNIESQKSISAGEIYLPKAKLDSSKYGILGRMMIVHADPDDLGKGGDAESLKTGNAGKRLACGVIGLAEPPTHKQAESKMNLELDQQDPNDPNRMWGPDVISPIFPLKGYERPVEEVRADLKRNLVGHEIKMWHDSHDKGFSRDFGFSEPQPSGTWGKVTGVSDSNPNMPWVIGVWVTITQGGSPNHPKGSRVWFHVKDSHFPLSMSKGWYEGDYLKAEEIRECCECSTTEGLTTIQAGTFCWDCLPINLGAESSEEDFACTDYIIEEIKRIWYSPAQKDIKHWAEHNMAGGGLGAYYDGFDLPDGSELGEDTTKDEYFQRMFDIWLEAFEEGTWMYSDDDHGIMMQAWRVLYVPVGTPVNVDSLGNWENRKQDQYGVYGDKITSWLWQSEFYAGALFGHEGIDHMEGEEGKDFDRIVLTAWIPWEAVDWASTIAYNISFFWQENELCVKDKETVYELNYSRNWLDEENHDGEASLDKAMNAEEKVLCGNCNWSWNRSEGGDDLFICHKCGTDTQVSEAEVHLLPDDGRAGWYDRHDDSVNINLANKGIRNEALEDNYSGLFDTIAHEYGHQVTSHETRSPYHSEFAAFMVQTNGDFARSKLLAVIHPMCFHEIIMKLPPDSNGMISDETLDNFFSTLDFENNLDIIVQAKRFVTYSTIPEWHKDWLKHLISYVETGTAANVSFEAEDNYDSTYGVKQAKVRRKLKNKIKKQAIMGTKAGQWSARKSQELKRQYEAACSKKGLKPYQGQKTKSQDNLSKWSKQGWKTASGKKSSVTGEPYFPAKAVTALKQKNLYAKAKRQKQAATKAGKQNARYSDDIRAVVKQYRAEDTECEVCRVPLSPEEKSLCNTCWESYEQSLKPQKEWWAESKRFSAPYQPNQTLLDYSPYEMATSSAITGDFFTDSLKYGFGPESKSSENVR